MKGWIVALASLALGILVGCGFTWYEFSGVPELFATSDLEQTSADNAAAAPKVRVVDGLEYNFDVMQLQTAKSHEFVIKNEGGAPLKLEKANAPTCQCTKFEVPSQPIAPGESGVVLLEWVPKEFNPNFKQTAEVRTNDPTRELLTLTITGSVVQAVRPMPSEITVSGISANEERSAQARIFGYLSNELAIASFEFLNRDLAPFFDARWEPISERELREEKFARSGVLLTVTVKPGLPLGDVDQTIRLVFEGAEATNLEIPIKGTVASDVSLFGPSVFDKENRLLKLGLLKASQGAKTELRVLIKGPHRHDTRLSIAATEPENILRVTLGEPSEINNGKVVMYVLTIEIPPGSPPINRIGSQQIKSGQVLIDTTHPQAKQLKIGVNFAIEE